MSKITSLIHNRAFILTILFLILCSLCIYYFDNFQSHQKYPTPGSIIKSYPEGKMVSVSGTVTQTFPDGFYLQDKKINYTIYSSQKVNQGDLVEVIGLLGPKYTITAKQVTSTPLWSYQFVLLRSFIAFLFLVFIFNRYWTFNREKWVFQRRKEPKRYLIRRK